MRKSRLTTRALWATGFCLGALVVTPPVMAQTVDKDTVRVSADWDVARDALATKHKVPKGRQIVSVFRIGRPKGTPKTAHARLSVDELLA